MAKNIRWQIPFVSLSGVHYRIDIYDEGTFTPVTLTGGTSPFTTSENDSEDYFEPIRTQTGTIEVCTLMPNGNYITLDDLLPANNIARPVRLINRDNADAIEWQGFLNCEAYDQDYTSIPQIIQLPVIGILEAMASVPLKASRLYGLITIIDYVIRILEEIKIQSGIECFTHMLYSRTDYNIWLKLINTSILFEEKSYTNEYNTTYIVDGVSAKDALNMICKYMGWIARQDGTSIYLQRSNEEIGFYKSQISPIYSGREEVQIIEEHIEQAYADKWMGTDHKRSISAGAKSVEVIAKVKSNKLNLKLNEFPFGDSSDLVHESVYGEDFKTKYVYMQVNYNDHAYNNDAYMGYYKFETAFITYPPSDRELHYRGETTREEFLDRLTLFSSNVGIWANPHVAGAILVRFAIQDEETTPDNFDSGLYCPLMVCGGEPDTPIYKMRTFKIYTFHEGNIKINADMLFMALTQGPGGFWANVLSDQINGTINCQGEKMTMVLRVGAVYWNGTVWDTTRSSFQIPMEDRGIDIKIPISFNMAGDVELEILSGVTTTHNNTLCEVIFKSLTLTYENEFDAMASDRSENNYIRLLETNFRDTISISTDLASNNYNQLRDSVIFDLPNKPLEVLQYYLPNGTTESRRPEVDLLNRLATYYQAARQRLSLIVEHLSTPLPLLRLNGISPDNRKYLPLAEERDWQKETCTLTCFETPEEPSES